MNSSSSVTRVSQSSRKSNCRSMRFTSGNENPNPSYPLTTVYLAQCLFLGLESLRFFAARIRLAKKMRCTVQRMPLATGGSRERRRSRKTRDAMRVGTCTWERVTMEAMNVSTEGSEGTPLLSRASSVGGVLGGVGC